MEIIGEDFDYLLVSKPVENKIDRNKKKTKKSCVVTSIRNEGISILEWVAHYKTLGFDSIFIYSNDNTDQSDVLLLALEEIGDIYWINNIVPDGGAPQTKAFRHAAFINKLVSSHEWVTFLDADEFIFPRYKGQNILKISEYLDLCASDEEVGAIVLNWEWFSGELGFFKSDNFCIKEFTNSHTDKNFKTIFKYEYLDDVISPHVVSLVDEKKYFTSSGEIIERVSNYEPSNLDYGCINHYWQKSFQEYYLKKNRGRGAVAKIENLQRSYEDFFIFWSKGDNRNTLDPVYLVNYEKNYWRLMMDKKIQKSYSTIMTNFRDSISNENIYKIYKELKLVFKPN